MPEEINKLICCFLQHNVGFFYFICKTVLSPEAEGSRVSNFETTLTELGFKRTISY